MTKAPCCCCLWTVLLVKRRPIAASTAFHKARPRALLSPPIVSKVLHPSPTCWAHGTSNGGRIHGRRDSTAEGGVEPMVHPVKSIRIPHGRIRYCEIGTARWYKCTVSTERTQGF
ncbi:hypothetical protein F4802DRAFT_427585 [Xylaria palmicola]|nr:hypothetical protein F4802DRAFT_427585 [Xylaria palmicola]